MGVVGRGCALPRALAAGVRVHLDAGLRTRAIGVRMMALGAVAPQPQYRGCVEGERRSLLTLEREKTPWVTRRK